MEKSQKLQEDIPMPAPQIKVQTELVLEILESGHSSP